MPNIPTPAYDAPDPAAAALQARLRVEEYSALRATIRERGTRRVTLITGMVIGWAALSLAAYIWLSTPLTTVIPLIVLVAGFEAAFALHVGVERIGRYLQVEYEGVTGAPAWEHTAMQFGAHVGTSPAAGRVDPLFTGVFALATLLNLIPVLEVMVDVRGSLGEIAIASLAHAAFLVRLIRARRYALRQRELDLAALARIPRKPVSAA